MNEFRFPAFVARAIALYCLAVVVWGVCIAHRVLIEYSVQTVLPSRISTSSTIYIPPILYTHQNELKSILLPFYVARHQVFSGSYTFDGLPRALPRYYLISRRPRRDLRPVYRVGRGLRQISERMKSH